MERSQIRVRLNGQPGGGLMHTAQVDIVFVDVKEKPEAVREQFVYLHARGVPVTSLLQESFWQHDVSQDKRKKSKESGTSTSLRLGHSTPVKDGGREIDTMLEGDSVFSKPENTDSTDRVKQQREIHWTEDEIVGISCDARLPHTNTVSLSANSREGMRMWLSLDRGSYHEVGISARRAQQGGSRVPRALRDSRVCVEVRAPCDKRTVWALSPERVGRMDVLISRGSVPPRAPRECTGAVELRSVDVSEEWGEVSADFAGRIDVELLACGGEGEQDGEQEGEICGEGSRSEGVRRGSGGWPEVAADVLEAAQQLLTDIDVDGAGQRVAIVRRRYRGFCNATLEAAVMDNGLRSIRDGRARYVVVGSLAHGHAAAVWRGRVCADRGSSWPGFGGDAGMVTVLGGDGRSVTYEIRAECDA